MAAQKPKPLYESNPELVEYRIEQLETAVKENTALTNQVLKEVQSMSYVPLQEFMEYKEQIESKFNAIANYNTQVYRRKDDGKNFRVFAISVGTAVTIAVVVIIVQFVLKGAFGNGQ